MNGWTAALAARASDNPASSAVSPETQLSRSVSRTVRGHSRRIWPFLVRRVLQTWAVAPELSAAAPLGRSSPLPQHDPSHRAAADALNACDQLSLSCTPAAAVVAHLVEDLAQRQVAMRRVRPVDYLQLPQ